MNHTFQGTQVPRNRPSSRDDDLGLLVNAGRLVAANPSDMKEHRVATRDARDKNPEPLPVHDSESHPVGNSPELTTRKPNRQNCTTQCVEKRIGWCNGFFRDGSRAGPVLEPTRMPSGIFCRVKSTHFMDMHGSTIASRWHWNENARRLAYVGVPPSPSHQGMGGRSLKREIPAQQCTVGRGNPSRP